MNNRLLLALFFVTIIYIGIGGVAFHFLESSSGTKTRLMILDYIKSFRSNFTCMTDEELIALIDAIQEANNNNVEVVGLNQTAGVTWDYSTSVFFSFTVVTTIGYGHITPSTLLSRVFCAFYSFFGIPLFLVTCAGIGDKLRVANNKLEAKLSPKSKSKLVKAGLSLLLFTMGFVLFVFVPAVIFHAMESWDLASSLYFVWITLTTIGFGDLVPDISDRLTGEQNAAEMSYSGMYRAGIIIWIFIGLTWMAGVISTVQDIFSEAASKVQRVVHDQGEHEEGENSKDKEQDV